MKNSIPQMVMAFLFLGTAHAQGTAPPTDASPRRLTATEVEAAHAGAPFRQFSAWLEAFNSGDRSRLGAFLEQQWPSARLDPEMNMREQSGGFELRALEAATATSLAGLLQERNSDSFARFTLVIEPDEPHRISSLSRRLIPRPADFPVPPMTEAQILAELRVRLEKATAADRFSGAVLVTRNGKTLFSGAYGLADREKKVANTLDTRFRVGSMNKMFTATAILQLVQGGKLKLTDPLGKYLTDYPNQAVATQVTIHQLLTHTGGTGDIFGPDFDAHRLELRTLNDYLALYGKRGLAFEPGTRWEYSNYGMVLLGAVIEKVSGQSYYDYVTEHIYKPAGMTRTGSEPEDKLVPGRAIGYMHERGGAWTPNTDTLPVRGTSAGGGYSTVGDMVRFANALMKHKLLNAEYTELLITGKVDLPGGGAKYAYGFEDSRQNGVGSVGHGGGAPGMNGQLKILPQSGYVVAVLSNLDPPAAETIASFLDLRLGR
jgi:D-alanyl-D-alanine carboxypeptidase